MSCVSQMFRFNKLKIAKIELFEQVFQIFQWRLNLVIIKYAYTLTIFKTLYVYVYKVYNLNTHICIYHELF